VTALIERIFAQSITIGSIDGAKRHLVNKANVESTTTIEGGVLQRIKKFINKVVRKDHYSSKQ
jgi:hypothetical protein